MQIFVDADACPVVGIVEKVAKEHSVPCLLYTSLQTRVNLHPEYLLHYHNAYRE